MAQAPSHAALRALADALKAVEETAKGVLKPADARRIRDELTKHARALETVRAATDTVRMPKSTFDPASPKIIGRMVSLALFAQPMMPLGGLDRVYGSGTYAIYYHGANLLYAAISGTETPIYVGKADPSDGEADTPREQGARLTGRLIEHSETIAVAEAYAKREGWSADKSLQLEDFTCRRLVCATNAQLAAEKQLIRMFWPLWNSDTKACWGMSKHGDSAGTRKNKRSPWDVVHPGRPWALDNRLDDSLSRAEITKRIDGVLLKSPPRKDHAALLEEMLAAFRQDGAPEPLEEPPPLADVAGPSEDEAGGSDS
jgi:hypothetical protein